MIGAPVARSGATLGARVAHSSSLSAPVRRGSLGLHRALATRYGVSIVTTPERTSMTSRLSALSLFVLLCHLSLGAPAEGADFTGAWTTDTSVCNRVFVKSGARISFTKDSELLGGGLIFQGKEIQGTGALLAG